VLDASEIVSCGPSHSAGAVQLVHYYEGPPLYGGVAMGDAAS
jgi:hypothetical protein